MLTPEILSAANRSVLCWLATADESGQPNVSPKEIFAIFDSEYLVIANIASPSSARNIEANSCVCVSFIDVFVQKGFKVVGTASNVRKQDNTFALWVAPLKAKTASRYPIHSVFVVHATSVEPILAPSYRLYQAETTEESQIQSALRVYGVHSMPRDA